MSTAAETSGPKNPFPGLRPFEKEDEHLFFGRESQVDAMVDKLAATRFLAVVGGSGSGKSSLVNCGLGPALPRGYLSGAGANWKIVKFRPGSTPLPRMASALTEKDGLFGDQKARVERLDKIVETTLRMSKLGLVDVYEQAHVDPKTNLLLVVDQFEELFRYGHLGSGGQGTLDVTEDAIAFVNLLLEARKQRDHPIYVVLTMRSDFLGDCAQFLDLPEAINEGQYLVPRMTRDERRAAISKPAQVEGAEFSRSLLTRLVNDVGDNPDQLSVLQHVLNRTWAYWEADGGEGPLSLEHYEKAGGLSGALNQHAGKETYEKLDPAEQEICEKLFKALTDKAADPRGVRRPTKLGDLCALIGLEKEKVAAVIETFREPSRSFLTPASKEELTDESVIDISHESLMRYWSRLNDWADEEAVSATIYQRLVVAAAEHREGKGSLYVGATLARATEWEKEQKPNAAWAERYGGEFERTMEFLHQSERVWKRRLITGAVMVVLVVVVAIVVAIWMSSLAKQSLRAERSADDAAKLAKMAQLEAQEERDFVIAGAFETLATQAAARPDRDQEWLYTLTALRILPKRRPLSKSKSRLARVRPSSAGHASRLSPQVTAIDQKGTLLAAAEAQTVYLWDLKTGEPVPILYERHGDTVRSLAISPDGSRLASGSRDGTVKVWDLGKPELPPQVLLPGGAVYALAFGGEKKPSLAAGTASGVITIWPASLEESRTLPDPRMKDDQITSLCFSEDGRVLAAASIGGKVSLWDTQTDKFSTGTDHGVEAKEGESKLLGMDLSEDGRWVAYGRGEELLILDRNAGAGNAPWSGNLGSQVRGVHIMEEEESMEIAVATENGALAIYDRIGKKLRDLRKDSDSSEGLAWVQGGGGWLATVAGEGPLTLWRGKDSKPVAEYQPALPGEAEEEEELPTLPEGVVFTAEVSREGKLFAVATEEGSFWLWRREAEGWKKRAWTLHGEGDFITALAFSDDERWLAAGIERQEGDWEVHIWDAKSLFEGKEAGFEGEKEGATEGGTQTRTHDNAIRALVFNRKGDQLVSGDAGGTLKHWRWAGGRWETATDEPESFGDTVEVTSLAFQESDERVLAGCNDGKIRSWQFKKRDEEDGKLEPVEAHAQKKIRDMQVSEDGSLLVTASEDGRISLRRTADLTNSAKTFRAPEFDEQMVSVGISTDNRLLAAGSSKGKVYCWDLLDKSESGQEPLVFWQASATGWARGTRFLGDSLQLATVEEDGLRLSDLRIVLGYARNGAEDELFSAVTTASLHGLGYRLIDKELVPVGRALKPLKDGVFEPGTGAISEKYLSLLLAPGPRDKVLKEWKAAIEAAR